MRFPIRRSSSWEWRVFFTKLISQKSKSALDRRVGCEWPKPLKYIKGACRLDFNQLLWLYFLALGKAGGTLMLSSGFWFLLSTYKRNSPFQEKCFTWNRMVWKAKYFLCFHKKTSPLFAKEIRKDIIDKLERFLDRFRASTSKEWRVLINFPSIRTS